MPERQAVRGLQAVQRIGPQTRTTDTAVTVMPEARNKMSFMGDLMQTVGAVGEAATAAMQSKVEEDKVVQLDRNLRGLMPSEDATVGGKRAHMLLSAQNMTDEQTANLTLEAKQWQGTDDEWTQRVLDSRNAISATMLERYPELQGDQEVQKSFTTMMMEQQPKLTAAYQGAKLEKEIESRKFTFNNRILSLSRGDYGADPKKANTQLMEEGRSLGFTDPEIYQMVTAQAQDQASAGNTFLTSVTQGMILPNGMSLYEANGSLQSAAMTALRVKTGQQQADLAVKRMDLEGKFNSGTLTQEQFLEQAVRLNQETGHTAYSAGAIESILTAKAKNAGKQGALTAQIQALKTGTLPALDPQDPTAKSKLAKAYHAQASADIDAMASAAGLSPEQTAEAKRQAATNVTTQLVRAGYNDAVLTSQVESFVNTDGSQLQNADKEPPEMRGLLDTMASLPEDIRAGAIGDKNAAFVANFEAARSRGETVAGALTEARKAGSGLTLSPDARKESVSDAASIVDTTLGGNFYTLWSDSASDTQVNYAKQKVTQRMYQLRQAGYSRERAETLASQEAQRTMGKYGDNVVFGDPTRLAGAMKVNQQDIGTFLDAYMFLNKESLSDTSGGYAPEDIYFDINVDRGTFIVKGGEIGQVLTTPQPLSVLGDKKIITEIETKVKGMDAEKQAQLLERMKKYNQGNYLQREDYKYGSAINSDPTKNTAAAPELPNIMELFFPKAEASQPYRSRTELGEVKANYDFLQYMQQAENRDMAGFDTQAKVFTPYNSDTRTFGEDTVGYGHKLTAGEKKNGFIMIDGIPVPYKRGESQLTETMAQKLVEQDLANHRPSDSGWAIKLDEMEGNAKRAILDTSYNMGKSFLSKNPSAAAAIKSGDIGTGMAYLLDAVNENGKRSTGLLARRANAFNMLGIGSITELDVRDDGEMYVKFDSEPSIDSAITSRIKDGWLKVAGPGELHPRSKPGTVRI